MTNWSKKQKIALIILAAIGFFGPNGVFLYFAFCDPDVLSQALSNPIFLALSCEAFMLMAIFAWLISAKKLKPGWIIFVLMSLIGSLAFSVPAYLLVAKGKNPGD